jgi:hypothetical protein
VEGQLQQSLSDHVLDKGREIHAKYGPQIGWAELERMLQDRAVVRYPCEIRFSSERLESGELAYPEPLGESPEEGFRMWVHPAFVAMRGMVPHLVLYQLVAVNYGDFASADDAETFGAAALGLERDDYYQLLCTLADDLEGMDAGGPGCC